MKELVQKDNVVIFLVIFIPLMVLVTFIIIFTILVKEELITL